jgi:EAL domain-containing protein (putative c-di-GMP-specific phosphodiesterase class I)/ActR/RegA family two-component response regulator
MSLADCTVMVVEDHEFQRSTTLQILANLGAAGVLEAADGEEALALLAAGAAPDVIVCDLDMPGMDGIEFLRRVAVHGPEIAIIIASGLDEEVLRAAEATARGYGLLVLGAIIKPLTARRLLQAVGLHQPLTGPELTVDPAHQDPWIEAMTQALVGVRVRPRVELASGRLGGLEVRAHRLSAVDGLSAREIDAASDPVGPQGAVALALAEHVAAIALGVQERLSHLAELVDVTIVLPAAALHQSELVDRLSHRAEAVGVEPARVCVAVPDAVAGGEALELLTRLRIHGFGLGFDGFGSATATLPELERLPLTEVKIAASALARATTSPQGAEAFGATVARLHDCGVEVVCDGCTSLAEWMVALGAGCRRAQGAFVGPPLAAEDVTRWLSRWEGVR